MKRNIFALLRTFVLVAFVPALALSLVACEPENDGEGTLPPGVTPEVSVPDGYVNYFVEDLSFSHSAGEVKVAFQINVDWSMEVNAPEGTSASWLSVEPASGAAGLHEIMIRVTANDATEVRTATIHLLSGKSKVAEILVTQEESLVFEAVDLGLSVKWASCNVGATSPEESGDYFAWGETEEKSNYTPLTYKYYLGDLDGNGYYYDSNEYQNIGSNISGTSYDVAHVKWGGSWRMPTLSEIQELCNKCSWEWTTVNGVSGQKVTGPNGNSIFLPAAGNRVGTEVHRRGSDGRCWSDTLNEDDSVYGGSAFGFCFGSGGRGWNYGYSYFRSNGQSVRPVTE